MTAPTLNLSSTGTSLTTSGYVGIGTTSPLQSLTVRGPTGNYNGNENNYHQVAIGSTSNAKTMAIGYDTTINAAYIGVSESGSLRDLLLQPRGGNVGIGMTAPSYPLDVGGVVHGYGGYFSTGSLGNQLSLWGGIGGVNFGFGIQSNLLQIFTDTTSSDIAFGSGQSSSFTERMRIKGNGLVGIGTTNPAVPWISRLLSATIQPLLTIPLGKTITV